MNARSLLARPRGLDCNAWRRPWRKRLADAFIGCCWALAVVGWIVVIPLAVYRIGGAG